MANRPKASSRKLVLGERVGPGRVRVEIEAFFEFSFWLAEELEDLISRHSTQFQAHRIDPKFRRS